MVFNATFKNISVISWWLVLLVEETEVPDLLQVTDELYHIMLYRVHLTINGVRTPNVRKIHIGNPSHVYELGGLTQPII
jgi:hypothetical protein